MGRMPNYSLSMTCLTFAAGFGSSGSGGGRSTWGASFGAVFAAGGGALATYF